MRRSTIFFFLLTILFSNFILAQDGSRSGQMYPELVNGPSLFPTDTEVIYSDDMDGNNDTTSLKARGYLPYYRGTGPQGATATWYQGGGVFPAYNGPTTGHVAANYSAVTAVNNIDNWLVFPALNLMAGDSLYFWQRSPDGSTYPDSIRVMFSPTSTTPEGSWIELGRFKTSTAGWAKKGFAVPQAAATGRLAIRYCVVNGGPSGSNSDYLGIDAISVVRAGAGPYSFFANFDNLTAGQRLACQDSVNWTTWSLDPCNTTEDPFVSNAQSLSAPNSVVIAYNNDLVKLHGDLTTGKWYTGFQFYIPTGKAGYFNMLSSFTTPQYWAFECYFDAGGAGRLMAGPLTTATTFAWLPNTWQWVEVVIDLDLDQAKFYIGGSASGTLVLTWPWTDGATTGVGPKVIDATDIFGFTANDQMYFDNFFIGNSTMTPVELSSFGANVNDAGQVVLNWSTATEKNNLMFEIERSIENGEFITVGNVKGNGTTIEGQTYSFTDVSVVPGKYSYRLKQVDFNGEYEYSNVVEVLVTAPLTYNLDQNYPNPFNPSTTIKYQIAENNLVTLKVYDMLGNLVTTLVNGQQTAGSYEVVFDATNYTSGVYFYTISAGDFSASKKFVLLK